MNKQDWINTANRNLTVRENMYRNHNCNGGIIQAIEKNIIDCLAHIEPADTNDPATVERILQRRFVASQLPNFKTEEIKR